MLKQLFNGELSLKATFWKFGVFGLIILYYAYKMFKSLAGIHGNGFNLASIFNGFSVSWLANLNVAWILAYLAISLFLIIYSLGIIKGIWRASAAYDKSIWLAWLARFFILGLVALVWYLIIYE